MVQVREAHPEKEDGSIDIAGWIARLSVNPDARASEQLYQACELARDAEENAVASENAWGDIHSSFRTGLEMAEILAELHLDHDSLLTAIVYRAVRESKLPIERVREIFGETVASLVDGVMRMAAISVAGGTAKPILGSNKTQSENVRKMLVAMVGDVRVALIKLAERTCAIRAVKDNPEKKAKVAKEVFEIYAPLAHRLGIGHIKWELEDLSFRYLEPENYKKVASLIDERRIDRQEYIKAAIDTLQTELKTAGIDAEVTGRVKHIYSIWRKMNRKRIGFSEVYDIRALRILVPEIRDCYTVLGIVHTLWRNIPQEFDDYVAMPKENGYRSLHTAVIGKKGKVLEIQIRTYEMHEEAELGVCSHWRYKGTDEKNGTEGYEEKISWLRQVLNWHEETGGVGDIAEQLSADVSEDHVYVFTPEGHVVELARGATPLDFAYHIHTEVGHRCRGVKVNGRIVPLTYQLETGEQVEVITGKESHPSRDWLRPKLAYLKTSSARAKVRHWFKQQDREHNIATGRSLLEKEFKRLALTSLDYKKVADRVNFPSVEDMYAAVGAGDMGPGLVLNAAQALVEPEVKTRHEPTRWRKSKFSSADADITIDGVGNLLTQIAKCCKPLPGDDISGYITVGRGVSIHRQDCAKVLELQQREPQRIIQVDWGTLSKVTYPVDIIIRAYDRHGLLSDISILLANEHINVSAMNTKSDKDTNIAYMRLTIEVTDLEILSLMLAKINRLPNIISVIRQREGG